MYDGLALLLGAYLHLDFSLEYATSDDAVRDFAEHESGHIEETVAEIGRLLAGDLDDAALQELLYDLGSGYRVEGDGYTPRCWLAHARDLLQAEFAAMVDFRVMVTPAAFSVTEQGLVAGPIWIHIAGEEFPSANGTDFPLLLLSTWISQLASATRDHAGALTLAFLESVGELHLSSGDAPLTWSVTARRADATTGPTLTVPAGTLESRVRQAAVIAVTACRSFGWSGDDIDGLARALYVPGANAS